MPLRGDGPARGGGGLGELGEGWEKVGQGLSGRWGMRGDVSVGSLKLEASRTPTHRPPPTYPNRTPNESKAQLITLISLNQALSNANPPDTVLRPP